MRIPVLLLAVSVLTLSLPACGASGGGSAGGGGDPLPQSVKFDQGDPSTTLGDLSLVFPTAGSPIDGELLLLATTAQLFLDAEQELQDLHLALLYLVTPATIPVLDTALFLDYASQIQTPALKGVLVDVWAAIHEDELGALAAALDTTISVNAEDGQGSLMAYLPRTGRVGFVDTGARFEVTRTFLGDGTADFDVSVETTAESPLAALVRVTINGVTEDLGTVAPDTAQRLTGRFNHNEWAIRLEVRFVTAADPFYEDIRVDFDFEIPELERRVADIGSDNERVWSDSMEMWNLTHPTRQAVPGEFPMTMAGEHHLAIGLLTPTDVDVVDARSQPVNPADTTYGSSTIGVRTEYEGPGKAGREVAPPVVAALISFGSWGLSIANFDNATMAFKPDDVVDTGNMTDLAPFDGDPESGQAVYVDNSADAIKFIDRNAMQQYVLDPAATLTNAAWPGASGRVVSAFRHASGDLLFVTDGDPGEFWVLKPGQTVATRIGNAGTAPRNIRAAGNIAAVGAYGSGLGFGFLGIYVRGASGTWGHAPFSKSGPRSVGIDVKRLPDGRVAIAYPSFLGNTLNITVVENATGEISKDESLPLPASCTNPGHCVFVRDDSVDAVLVSCNGSDNVVLMPVSYEETP